MDLKASTIERCFRKALHDPTVSATDATSVLEIQDNLTRLQQSQRIHDLMDIEQFLDPADEQIDDSLEQLDAQVLAQFEPAMEEESDDDPVQESQPKIAYKEALEALQRLRLYEEQQEHGQKPS